jgi:WD40 repeat protein
MDVLSVAFRADGKLLASSCDDRTIRLWDGETGSPVRMIEEAVAVRCVLFASDGDVKLSGAAEGSREMVLAGHTGLVRTLAQSPDGRTLASAGDDRTIRLWQAATGLSLLTLRGHEKPIYAAAFAPNCRSLATGCVDGKVCLWLAEADGL